MDRRRMLHPDPSVKLIVEGCSVKLTPREKV